MEEENLQIQEEQVDKQQDQNTQSQFQDNNINEDINKDNLQNAELENDNSNNNLQQEHDSIVQNQEQQLELQQQEKEQTNNDQIEIDQNSINGVVQNKENNEVQVQDNQQDQINNEQQQDNIEQLSETDNISINNYNNGIEEEEQILEKDKEQNYQQQQQEVQDILEQEQDISICDNSKGDGIQKQQEQEQEQEEKKKAQEEEEEEFDYKKYVQEQQKLFYGYSSSNSQQNISNNDNNNEVIIQEEQEETEKEKEEMKLQQEQEEEEEEEKKENNDEVQLQQQQQGENIGGKLQRLEEIEKMFRGEFYRKLFQLQKIQFQQMVKMMKGIKDKIQESINSMLDVNDQQQEQENNNNNEELINQLLGVNEKLDVCIVNYLEEFRAMEGQGLNNKNEYQIISDKMQEHLKKSYRELEEDLILQENVDRLQGNQEVFQRMGEMQELVRKQREQYEKVESEEQNKVRNDEKKIRENMYQIIQQEQRQNIQQQQQQQQLQQLEQVQQDIHQQIGDNKELVQYAQDIQLNKILRLKQKLVRINKAKESENIEEIDSLIRKYGKKLQQQQQGNNGLNSINDLWQQEQQQEQEQNQQQNNDNNNQEQQQEQGNENNQNNQNNNNNVNNNNNRQSSKFMQFMKNPDNVIKCVMLSVMLLCFSSINQFQAQIEDKNYKLREIFNLFESSRNTKQLVYTSVLSVISIFWYFMKEVWIRYLGESTEGHEKKVRGYMISYNPILQLFIIYITDYDLIQNKFDCAIWLVIFFVTMVYRAYLSDTQDMLKQLLGSIYQDYSNELLVTKKILNFVVLVFLQNLLFTGLGIWVFWSQGLHILCLMYYTGIIVFIESLKLILMLVKLRQNFQFYVDNNSDQITEPFYEVQVILECVSQVVVFIHQLQLFYNYSHQRSYSFFNHIWFVMPVRSMQQCMSVISQHFNGYRKQKKIRENLDRICPRVFNDEIDQDDKCSICHDELLKARKLLKCGHKFHIKCLFEWLKNQKNSKCPNCRQDIDIMFQEHQQQQQQQNQRRGNGGILNIISRVFRFLSNFSFGGINIQFIQIDSNNLNQQQQNNLGLNLNNNNNNQNQNQNQIDQNQNINNNNQQQQQGNNNDDNNININNNNNNNQNVGGFAGNILQRLGNLDQGLQQQLQAEIQQIENLNQQLNDLNNNLNDNNNNVNQNDNNQNNNQNDNDNNNGDLGNEFAQGMYL